VDELSDLAAAVAGGAFRLDARAVLLSGVAIAWAGPGSGQRLVLVP
jgi:hypothetical protein